MVVQPTPNVTGAEVERIVVAYLEGWYVDPEFRRKGVGRVLVDAAERQAQDQGCTEFGSDALIDNETSAKAHRGLGVEETVQRRSSRNGEAGSRCRPGRGMEWSGSSGTSTRVPTTLSGSASGTSSNSGAKGGSSPTPKRMRS